MSLLKTYIREIIKEYLYEEMADTPRLPSIPPSTSGGAIGKSTGRLKQARIKFANAALNAINQYYQILTNNRRFDPTIASHIYFLTGQILQELRTDTKNWVDIPREIETEMFNLRPQNSVLSNIRDNTTWAAEESIPTNQQELITKYQNVIADIPQVISALQAYKNFYSNSPT